ncbi:hypothetical protein [Actinacidiphila glaucinigra]
MAVASDLEAVVRVRPVAVSVLSAAMLLSAAPSARAADGWTPHRDGGRSARLAVYDSGRVGHAVITVHRVGRGWEVDALVTKEVDDPGCIYLATDDGDDGQGREIGAQCGSADTTTRMISHTEFRRLVLGWVDGDGVPVSRRSVRI